MGVYARQHAAEIATHQDPAPGKYVGTSPSARLMLLHIASVVPENGDFGYLWDVDARYYESLGLKGRALGYDVPPKMYPRSSDPDSTQPGAVPDAVYNAVKYSVNKAMRELAEAGLIKVESKGRAGRTAEYSLPFLKHGCRTCAHMKPGGKLAFSSQLHKNENREGVRFPTLEDLPYAWGEGGWKKS